MNKSEVRKIEEMKKKLKRNHSDLIHSVWLNYAVRISAAILLCIFLYISFNRFSFDNLENLFLKIIYYPLYLAVIIVLPIYIFRIHRILSDSAWKGTVIKIMLSTNMLGTGQGMIIHYEEVYVTHEYNDKKTWKMKLRKCDDDFNPIGYYKQGDEVMHYKGLKFCEKLDKSKDRYVICLYCGQLNLPEKDKCKKCRKSIVK